MMARLGQLTIANTQHCIYSSSKRRLLLDHVCKCHAREKRYRRPHCSYASNYLSHLKEHVRIHTGERPFKCIICPYSSAKRSSLNNHQSTHTGERPFKCMVCTFAAVKRSDLYRHKRKHTGERPFKCSQCPYRAAEKTHLNTHLRTHTGERPFKCTLCPYSAAQRCHLTKHRLKHPNIQPPIVYRRQMYILSTPLACYLCGGDSTVGDIGDHLAQVHIGAADSDWHCSNGCHYRTTSRADIASHCLITRHAASKITKPLIFAELLSEVQQRFMSALSCAQEHTTSTQSNECIPVPDVDVLNAPQSHSEVTKLVEEESFNLPEPRVLSVINAEADLFLGTSLDQLHVTYQVPEKIKDYRNEITPSDVENSDNEEEPSESEAEIESPMSPEQERLKQTEDEEIRNLVTALGDIRKKPLSCSHCSYTTNSKNNLVVHIRTHTGDRPFKCMICTYAASKSSDLNRHKLKHTEDRPYKCSQCPYRATQKTDFNTHFRTHTGERPFQCDICPYAATEKEQLKRHLLLHTGERPFKCNDCPYSCTQKLHLIKHVRTHAGKKGYTDGQRIGSL